MNSLIILSQETEIKKSIEYINRVCNIVKTQATDLKKAELEIADIIPQVEKVDPDTELPKLIGKELLFDSEDSEKDLLDLLFNLDDDEEAGESDAGESDAGESGAGESGAGESGAGESGNNSLMEGGADTPEEKERDEQVIKIKKRQKGENADVIKDLTNLNLTNPNPFFKRMQERDPKLFLTEIDSRFKAYSRICPSNLRRQPVILTDAEKAKIDELHPDSYDKAIKYGTSLDKEHWYICPRYWSLKDNVSLTESEVKSGDYGKIIPEYAKKISAGENIYEFTDDRFHKDKDGNYIKHYPGFVKEGSHPEGRCMPCCFKLWDSSGQELRRKQCANDKKNDIDDLNRENQEDKKSKDETKQDETKREKDKRDKPAKIDEYIKGQDKFPIDKNRWGYLPIAIQNFLQIDNKTCQISQSNTNLKPFKPCLLRHGVELNKNQSFVACIADAYNEYSEKSLSIKQMKKKIIDSLTLDNFMKYNNGNLIQLFGPSNTSRKSNNSNTSRNSNNSINKEINIELYKDQNIYKSIDPKNSNQASFLIKLIMAFNNFIAYLDNDNILINYSYLWDIVSMPNKNLFPEGLNLVILELINNDITDNVSIICPSNHYANDIFNINKYTLLIIKSADYYEPIYALEDVKTKFNLTRLFNLK